MISTQATDTMTRNDAELVIASLQGSREAFRQIVERYQTLVCSLAYSATGSVSQSEDVAQETFLAAWTQLRSLREPGKLRAWLCGIARNRIHRFLCEHWREPVSGAAPLEDAQAAPALEALPSDDAISREEEAILWRSLERIPELYREPLVLFYRQHQSIKDVAAGLELTEDAVKQRLSRGRKLLQEEVQAFVESTLRRSAPGQAFSGAVFAALPLAVGPAAAASVGAGAKGTAAAKPGFLAAWLVPLAPFLGIAAGVAAQCLIIRHTTSDRKLRFRQMVLVIVVWVVMIGLAVGGEAATRALGHRFEWSSRTRFLSMAGFWWVYLLAIQAWTMVSLGRLVGNRQPGEAAGEVPRASVAPMKPGTLALVVAGAHLALFSWLARLAWCAGDWLGTSAIAGTMVGLGVMAFLRIRGRTGAAALQAIPLQLGLCGLAMLLIFNLRFDVWVAAAYGVSVPEAHRLQPIWIVPLLSLGLLLWAGIVAALARPRPGGAQAR